MKLRDAILRAAKFCFDGKQRSSLANIRFLPEGRLYANHGSIGVMIDCDLRELPNIMVNGSELAAAAKEAAELLEIGGQSAGGEVTFVFQDKKGKSYTLKMTGGNVTEYPGIPALPEEWTDCPDWWAVEQVFHAVSKDKQQPALQCVKFSPDVVEATDRHRVARSFVHGNWNGLLPIEVFKQWPKGDVSYSFGDELIAFKVGDEVRITVPFARDGFPTLEKVFPRDHKGHRVIVDTDELRDLAKKVSAHGEDFIMRIEGDIRVTGNGIEANLDVKGDEVSAPLKMCVNAKWLHDSLKVVTTPNVALGYNHPQEPLRVESGVFVEGIWPLAGG